MKVSGLLVHKILSSGRRVSDKKEVFAVIEPLLSFFDRAQAQKGWVQLADAAVADIAAIKTGVAGVKSSLEGGASADEAAQAIGPLVQQMETLSVTVREQGRQLMMGQRPELRSLLPAAPRWVQGRTVHRHAVVLVWRADCDAAQPRSR